MNAKIEARWEDGCVQTFRDEDGGLWRIALDNMDGTLGVEEIEDCCGGAPTIPSIEERQTIGRTPCAVAVWLAGGEQVHISRCTSHGENNTDGIQYEEGGEMYHATPNGWEPNNPLIGAISMS